MDVVLGAAVTLGATRVDVFLAAAVVSRAG